MAKVICPNCGGENTVSTGKAAQECEYCGSFLNLEASPFNKKDNKDKSSDDSAPYTVKVMLSHEDLKVKVIDEIFLRLNAINRDSPLGDLLHPLPDKLSIFSYKVDVCYLPVYIYKGNGKFQDGSLGQYGFSICSEGPVKIGNTKLIDAITGIVNYKMDCYNTLPLERKKESAKITQQNFPKDAMDLWRNVYGREMRRSNLLEADSPNEIIKVYLPVYYVEIYINEEWVGYSAFNWRGDNYVHVIPSPEEQVARYLLGDDYARILEKNWADKQLRRQQELQELLRQYRKKKKRKRAKGCGYFIIAIIAIIILGWAILKIDSNFNGGDYEIQKTQRIEDTRQKELQEFKAHNPEKIFLKQFKNVRYQGSMLPEKSIRFKILNNNKIEYQTLKGDGTYVYSSKDWSKKKVVDYTVDLVVDVSDYGQVEKKLIIKFGTYELTAVAEDDNGKIKFSDGYSSLKLKDMGDNKEYTLLKDYW